MTSAAVAGVRSMTETTTVVSACQMPGGDHTADLGQSAPDCRVQCRPPVVLQLRTQHRHLVFDGIRHRSSGTGQLSLDEFRRRPWLPSIECSSFFPRAR